MIRRLPIDALQKGIYDILSMKQDSAPVYDNVPSESDLLYILLSDYEYEFINAKTMDISEITFEIEIWTEYRGKSQVNTIAEEIVALLTAWPIDLSANGFKVLSQDAKGGRGSRQEDLFYGIVNFTARVQNIGG
ncbi:hypothetical protein Ga0466249_005028 [Sporomusaceae bacterium BoRhaA]|uniref:tail completion protein gp17 n=1 Tax=Pelorhabdus rhamnosifermentans TaxID=2772457 RepID=UPI001C060F29|nr:DUF3168 domain-containing protein [Pelorhabdus rhamnosifermentans]MBU2703878.1 hypothetical protein [Pelorhabdus rhamnosifermentans]